jgi:class 3 adenylate cyclase
LAVTEVPKTYYAKSGELHLAYQVVGDGPVDLVVVSGTPSHVERQWEHPAVAHLYQRLGAFSRLILFDKRGSGLSDSAGMQPTLEDRMDDVRAVMDAAGSGRAVIFGQSEGSPMSLLFAASHPDRTDLLILYGSIVRWVGTDFPGATPPEEFYRHLDDVVDHWGQGRTADWIAPTQAAGPLGAVIHEGFGAFERASMSPGSFRDLMHLNAQIDVRAAVGAITVPSLVLHRVGDRFIGVEQSRWLAEQLSDARYVELPGEDHMLAAGDVDQVIGEIEEFVTGVRHEPDADRVLATLLFTDIVGSTDRAAELGDRRWRELLDAHDQVVRRQLDRFRGREVNTAGDGFFASFDGPGRAVRSAAAITESVSALGLEVRTGVHTGEIEMRGDDLAGVAVHIAARISAAAGAGETLVSSTVKDLVIGSGIQFADRGEHELKGVPGSWRLFAVSA